MTAAVSHVRWALLALLVLLAAPLGAQSSPGSTPPRSVADGVFTQEQAQRGETTFRSTCAACHTLGDFTGEVFLKRWSTVGSLFEVVSTTMPQDLPGTLSAQQYAELLAYFLSRNNFPAGSTELPGELQLLNAIAILPPKG